MFYHYAPERIDYAISRYQRETRRLYEVLDKRLQAYKYLAGDYSIADTAHYPGKAAARVMLKQGQGTILFTGATAPLRGSAGFVNLAAPKFALRALAQSMARELSPHGIHVAHVIIDGQIRSERYQHVLAEWGADSLLELDAIADAYLALHRQQPVPGRWSSIYGLGSRGFKPAL